MSKLGDALNLTRNAHALVPDAAAPPPQAETPRPAALPPAPDRVDTPWQDRPAWATLQDPATAAWAHERAVPLARASHAGKQAAEQALPYETHGAHVAEKVLDGVHWGAVSLELAGVHLGHAAGEIAAGGALGAGVAVALAGPICGGAASLLAIGTANMDGHVDGQRYRYEDGFAAGVAAELAGEPAEAADPESPYGRGLAEGRRHAASLPPAQRQHLAEALRVRYEAQTGLAGTASADRYERAMRDSLYF